MKELNTIINKEIDNISYNNRKYKTNINHFKEEWLIKSRTGKKLSG